MCVCLRGGGVHRPTKLLSRVDLLTGFKWLSLLVDCQLCCFLKAGDELKSKHNYRAFIKPRLMRGVWVAGGRKLFSSAQLRFVKHINKAISVQAEFACAWDPLLLVGLIRQNLTKSNFSWMCTGGNGKRTTDLLSNSLPSRSNWESLRIII